MNNYQMFRKIQERDNIIKKYSNDTKEDLIDLVIEKDNIIDNLQSKIDKAIEFVESMEYCGQEDYFYDNKSKDPCGNDNTFNDSKNKLLDILKEDK